MSSPEKKSKSKKGKKGKKVTSEDDSSDSEEKERISLIQQAIELKQDVAKEEKRLEYFKEQMEAIKFHWKIAKESNIEKKIELLQKQYRIKEIENDHQHDLDLYKQQIKHLLFEHQNKISLQVQELEVNLKTLQNTFSQEDQELKSDILDLRSKLKENELSHNEFIRSLRTEQLEKLSDLRKEYNRKTIEIMASSENTLKATKENRESKIQQQILEIEKEKDLQINEIMHFHKQELNRLRKEHNQTTQDNLDLIKDLKNQVAKLKKEEKQNEKALQEVTLQNKNITVPLEQGNRDIDILTNRLSIYEGEKRELNQSKEYLRKLQSELDNLKWKHEVLFQQYIAAENEHEEYRTKVRTAVYEAQQKCDLKNVILDKKLQNLSDRRDFQTATLNELLNRENFDPNVVDEIKSKLTHVVDEKNECIEELQNKLKQIKLDRKALKSEHQAKLKSDTE